VKNVVNHHCYIPSDFAYSWPSAKSACEKDGIYYLVSITSQEEMDFVASLLPSVEIWIGGNYQGAWTWASGEPWGYAPWAAAQPDGDGQCLVLGPGLSFSDAPCLQARHIVCERAPAGQMLQ
jgi:hypothetical protein